MVFRRIDIATFIDHELRKPFTGRTVVVTHHAPLIESSTPVFSGTPPMPHSQVISLIYSLGDRRRFGYTVMSIRTATRPGLSAIPRDMVASGILQDFARISSSIYRNVPAGCTVQDNLAECRKGFAILVRSKHLLSACRRQAFSSK